MVDVQDPGRTGQVLPDLAPDPLRPVGKAVSSSVRFSPSRAADRRHCGPNAVLVRIAAVATRTCGAGIRCSSQSSRSSTGSPRRLLAKIDDRTSRQPPVVLTQVPSVWNSTSPSASRNGRAASGSSRCQARMRPPWRSQILRTVLSQTTRPATSRRWRAQRSNDQSAPRVQSSRWACGLTKPSRPRRSSGAWACWPRRRQVK
ncbi:hypothetical protein [Aquisphaera giovannonii]|uniref:hypothetical protein n=1 Tax=Aquisphaera giovannonii TaxID=406548 RepID=UPI0011DF8549|nr:hypothetical protein [Aquisphaera giovannonii]